jgi:hypothetical protein
MPRTPRSAALPGLGPVSRGWLADVGIHTRAQLQRADLIACWLEIRALHPSASRNLYDAMWGAAHGCTWREVPAPARRAFDDALGAAGLAPRPKATRRGQIG